jgi:DNA-binding response OmpR family regulator
MNAKTNTPTAPGVSPKVILLVDDDPSVRQMVGRVLREEGYLVLNAANGAEALGIADTNHIDLVLLDLNMPVQGGWDTFEKLTARDPLVAVIIITARPNQLFTSLGAGVGALLEKPFDFPTLLKTVKTLLAESAELRLARLIGEHAGFHYHRSTGLEVMAGGSRNGNH